MYREHSGGGGTASVAIYGGVGLFGLLGIVFIVLKLVGVIDWSWWFVLMPIYIPFALGILLLIIAVIVSVLNSDY